MCGIGKIIIQLFHLFESLDQNLFFRYISEMIKRVILIDIKYNFTSIYFNLFLYVNFIINCQTKITNKYLFHILGLVY